MNVLLLFVFIVLSTLFNFIQSANRFNDNLRPVTFRVNIGDLSDCIGLNAETYYVENFDYSGPTIVSFNAPVPDDIDIDENVLDCFEQLNIHGLGSNLVRIHEELPEDAVLLSSMIGTILSNGLYLLTMS